MNEYATEYCRNLTQTGGQYIRGPLRYLSFFSLFKPQDSDSNLNLEIAELRTLLEGFANYQSLDVIDYHRRHRCAYWQHWSWRGFESGFTSVDIYIRKVSLPLYYYISVLIRYLKPVLLDPGFVLVESTCNTEGNRLCETGQHFHGDKYHDHFDCRTQWPCGMPNSSTMTISRKRCYWTCIKSRWG